MKTTDDLVKKEEEIAGSGTPLRIYSADISIQH
jgi:hypothetical protein